MGLWALVMCTWALVRFGLPREMPMLAFISIVLGALPWLQYWAGLIPAAGQALISSLYFLSACVCIATAAVWQKSRPGQLFDFIAVGTVVSACVNVAIQLVQWMNLYSDDPVSWFSLLIFPVHESARPLGNLAQPNLLATLISMAIACVAWLMCRRNIGFSLAIAAVLILSLGSALTQSRVGILQLVFLFALAYHYRRLWLDRRVLALFASALAARIVFFLILPMVAEAIGLDKPWRNVQQMAANSDRWLIWKASFELIAREPIWGYGLRSMLEPLTHSSALGYLGHPHNIVLDFLLWFGVPLGIAITLGVAALFFYLARHLDKQEAVPLFMVLVVLLVHAMLEFPHQYFHLLLVPCFALGVLIAILQQGKPKMATQDHAQPLPQVATSMMLRRLRTTGALLITALVLCWTSAWLVITEYLHVEEAVRRVMLLSHRNVAQYPYDQRPLYALGHMSDSMQVTLMRPSARYTLETLSWMERSVAAETYQQSHFNLAASMALAGYQDRARYLLWTLAKSSSDNAWNLYATKWSKLQAENPQLSQMPWPRPEDLGVAPAKGRSPLTINRGAEVSGR